MYGSNLFNSISKTNQNYPLICRGKFDMHFITKLKSLISNTKINWGKIKEGTLLKFNSGKKPNKFKKTVCSFLSYVFSIKRDAWTLNLIQVDTQWTYHHKLSSYHLVIWTYHNFFFNSFNLMMLKPFTHGLFLLSKFLIIVNGKNCTNKQVFV